MRKHERAWNGSSAPGTGGGFVRSLLSRLALGLAASVLANALAPGGAAATIYNLGTLGGTNSGGYAVNGAGQVAGDSQTTGGVYHAFRYDGTPGSGVMRDLGTLGGTVSGGYGINTSGQVAGSSQITGDSASHAFRYDGTPGSGGIMRDLGTLGGTNSFGESVNDAGQVAGWSEITGDATQHAFLYTGTPGVDGHMIDLDAWLDADNPAEGAKWTLAFAHVSNTGWITGTGKCCPVRRRGTGARTPPPPSSCWA